MSMTRDRLAESVHHNTRIPRKRSREIVDSAVELIQETLVSGEALLISGFGKFEVRNKASRRGRASRNGDALPLDARRVVTFKPSGVLRRKLNG